MRIRRPGIAAVLLALAASACRDLPTAAPAEPAPAERAELRCTVGVRDGSMSCEPSRPGGARAQIILGGQGLHVRLRTINVVWNGVDNVLNADVSVQNLLDQPIGTDGLGGTHGVRVFFVSGPNVTQGSGEVSVITDSMGTFTASNQKYYVYPEVIEPRGVSAPLTWSFSVPPQAIRFEFLVLVETEAPAEASAFHFRPEGGSPVFGQAINGVWAATAHDVFAVAGGAVLHYDGNYWRAMDAGGCGCGPLNAVWGSDGRDVWAVGGAGAVLRWTGGAWDPVPAPAAAGANLYGVWGAGAADVWAVGAGGTIIHYDGAGWTAEDAGGYTGALFGVWGAGAASVYAVGELGTILHRTGGSWQADTAFAGVTFYAVWGTGAADVYAAGENAGTGVLYHNGGTGWVPVADPELGAFPLFAGWSSSPTDVWVASGADVLHFNGTWTRLPAGSGAPVFGVAGTSGADVFAVGDVGTIAHSTGGAFAPMAGPASTLVGLWGSSASDVWAVGGTAILHRAGTPAWTSEAAPDLADLHDVWGASAAEVWAVGTYGIIRNMGSGWSTAHLDSALTLNAVWGASAADVWAAGDNGALLHWNGTAWSDAAFDTESRTALWGTGPANVFAVSASGAIHRWTGGG
ncbi:MAG TPA: hypothetical protein VFJ16_04345, partial [Longimicrobium sp.]|nr:hypothetical protein [Longimicrobium sp.]